MAGAGAAFLVFEGHATCQGPWSMIEETQVPEECGATTEVQSCLALDLIHKREKETFILCSHSGPETTAL